MGDTTPGLAGGSASKRYGSAVEAWASKRQVYLDNLKILLIAGVIVGHAIFSYADVAWWLYADVREVTLAPLTEITLFALAGPAALLLIPLLFLVAGLLTPPSLHRKGTAAYVRDRLLRLGVPFAVFALLLWRLLEYAVFRPLGQASGSFWDMYFDSEEPLQSGPLWFIGALLIYSLVYAGWTWLRRSNAPRVRPRDITAGDVLVITVVVAIATVLVRLVIPFDSDSYLALDLYRWPECIAMFGLGIAASRHGWLTAVPDRLYRQSRTATMVAFIAFLVLMGAGSSLGLVDEQAWTGGWNWVAIVFAGLESVLAVFGPVWVLGAAQRHLNRPFRWASPVVSRGAYGAFMVHGVVIVLLALALRPLPLAAEVKALAVAAIGAAASFALAWLLLKRIPGVDRVL